MVVSKCIVISSSIIIVVTAARDLSCRRLLMIPGIVRMSGTTQQPLKKYIWFP